MSYIDYCKTCYKNERKLGLALRRKISPPVITVGVKVVCSKLPWDPNFCFHLFLLIGNWYIWGCWEVCLNIKWSKENNPEHKQPWVSDNIKNINQCSSTFIHYKGMYSGSWCYPKDGYDLNKKEAEEAQYMIQPYPHKF